MIPWSPQSQMQASLQLCVPCLTSFHPKRKGRAFTQGDSSTQQVTHLPHIVSTLQAYPIPSQIQRLSRFQVCSSKCSAQKSQSFTGSHCQGCIPAQHGRNFSCLRIINVLRLISPAIQTKH